MSEILENIQGFVRCPDCGSDNAVIRNESGWGRVDTFVKLEAYCSDCESTETAFELDV